MTLYRVPIRLSSPLITPLKGDTVWGHVAWGIANHEGDAAVQEFLAACRKEEPAFVISSAFPAGFICKPLPKPQARDERLSPEKYAEIKKHKKERYVPASDYLNVPSPVSGHDGKHPFEPLVVTRNSINRFSNTVTDGGLYAVTEQWTMLQDFDLYVATSYPVERVRQLCGWAFENGYGADAAIGRGSITVQGESAEVRSKCGGTAYMALAPFVLPRQNPVTGLRADTFVRNGKIGGAFVSSMSPWKKTVVMYDEGSVFMSERPLQYVGTLLENVHSDSRICQSGFAPVIPVEEEV